MRMAASSALVGQVAEDRSGIARVNHDGVAPTRSSQI
jgi:hypothetical protein